MLDVKIHELATEILKQNSLMTMKEAVELAKKVIKDQELYHEKLCMFPAMTEEGREYSVPAYEVECPCGKYRCLCHPDNMATVTCPVCKEVIHGHR